MMTYLGLTGVVAYWMMGMGVGFVLLFVLVLILFGQNARLRKRVRRWQSIHETADLERVYHETMDRLKLTNQEVDTLQQQVKLVEAVLKTKVSTAQVKRFNAFSNTGSDLSYAVALLDDHQNGVVLSSIYGREETRTYAKPIVHGHSDYVLTDEERDVLVGNSNKQTKVPELV